MQLSKVWKGVGDKMKFYDLQNKLWDLQHEAERARERVDMVGDIDPKYGREAVAAEARLREFLHTDWVPSEESARK